MPTWKVRFDLLVRTTDPELLAQVARAHALAQAIRNIPLPPRITNKINRLNILRAVKGTTALEGADLTEEEVSKILAHPKKPVLGPSRSREEQEVLNAEAAMRHVTAELHRDPHTPLTDTVVCELHRIITSKIDYPKNEPGVYRRHPVQVGSYIPPRSGSEVTNLMKSFFRWLNQGPEKSLDPTVKAVAAHFYFISIHPFGDGNGRTARIIESFFLFQGGVNARGFYSLANFYYRERSRYAAMLDHVRFQSGGDLTPFVKFALRGLVDELTSLHQEVIEEVRRISFRDFARETLLREEKLRTKTGERMVRLLTGLTRIDEGVSLSELLAGEHFLYGLYAKSSRKTLTRDLNFLKKLKLVTVQDGRLLANLEVMDQFQPGKTD